MTREEIHERLTEVFRDVFDDPTLVISDATTARDVEGWDSLMHVNLIVATEKALNVSFTTKQVQSLTNVGDFISLIASRLT